VVRSEGEVSEDFLGDRRSDGEDDRRGAVEDGLVVVADVDVREAGGEFLSDAAAAG
jgi:hypothetical protein